MFNAAVLGAGFATENYAEAQGGHMAAIFISHARADQDVAAQIDRQLRRSGYEVADGFDIPLGVDWRTYVHDQIERADIVLSFWSQKAAESEFVKAELQAAAIGAWAKGRLLLINLDGTELPAGLNDLPSIRVPPRNNGDVSDWLYPVIAEVHDRLRPASYPMASPSRAEAPAPRAPSLRASRSLLPIAIGAIGALVAIVVLWLLKPQIYGEPVSYPPAPSGDGKPSILWILTVVLLVSALAYWAWRRDRREEVEVSAALPTRDAPQTQASTPTNIPATQPDISSIDVFISYSRIDSNHVNRVVDELRAQGLRVWIDTTQQSSDARYAGPIVRAIRACRSVVLMCSQNSFRSDHVVREVYVSGDARKHFIAVQLDTSELPDDFTYFLSGFPRLSLSELDPSRLASRVRELLPA